MTELRHVLFPNGLTLKANELLLAVEHGPDENGVAILCSLLPQSCVIGARARGENEPASETDVPLVDCLHALRHATNEMDPLFRLCTLGRRCGVAAVVPAGSDTCDSALLRTARHVIVVRALPNAAAHDVHGSVQVAKRDGRWRRNAEGGLYRFRIRGDRRVDVIR